MQAIEVRTSTNLYKVYIGKQLRFRLKELLPKSYSRILVITDDAVAPLYLRDVKEALEGEGTEVFEVIIPKGEYSKNIEEFYHLQTVALEHNLDRNSLIVALGGGVIGDLSGFVAATFMRGIDYVQVPTTILAHDSSVGGKVAINHELGKNLIGAFYPPVAVVYDIDTLQTLPEHEVRSGYAEIIKEAFIADESLLHTLMDQPIYNLKEEALSQCLYKGISIKAHIVEEDERESYMRMFLNFGHTLAHAIEAELQYGDITHGEAVALGMLFALRVSEDYMETDLPVEAFKLWLQHNGYPLSLFSLERDALIEKMKLDKKSTDGKIQMVLLKQVAEPTVVYISDEEIAHYLDAFIKELNKL